MPTPFRKRAYGQNLPLVDIFPFPIFKTRAPGSKDKNFNIGQVWVYKVSNTVRNSYMFGGLTSAGVPIWMQQSNGAGDISTLTGSTGGAISPTAGNITLAAGTGMLSIAGSGSTLTFNVNFAAPPALGSGTPAAVSSTILTHGKENYTTLASTTSAGALSAGSVALVGGTATIASTAVTANSLIRISVQALGTVTTAKAVAATAKTAGVSFVLTSADATDTSTIFWEIIN